jgi:UDP-glucose 4-epimerase
VREDAPILPKNAYGVSKAAAEMYCRMFSSAGMDVVVLRLTNVYGPRDRGRVIPLFTKKALRGKRLTVFGGGKVLDFLWIDDLVDVLRRASRCPCPNAPVNVGNGKGTRLVDLAQRISAVTGGGSTVHVAEHRQPEVDRFVADVAAARRLFDLQCPQDPVEHLPLIVEHLRREERTHAAAVRIE